MQMTATMQAVLYNIKKRHRPKPAPFSFAQVPVASAANNGQTITVIDRNYRLATSNGAVWQWAGTVTTIT